MTREGKDDEKRKGHPIGSCEALLIVMGPRLRKDDEGGRGSEGDVLFQERREHA